MPCIPDTAEGRSEGGLYSHTGDQVTENFFAVLLGNKSAITGGSKKVIDSKPNDHIFIYYSDHGGPGVLGTYLDFMHKRCCLIDFLCAY